MVAVPQPDGTTKRFPASAPWAAFLNALARHRGEDEPEHPLSAAARTSSDPKWRESVVVGPEEVGEPPEDLSE
jgi:hypothetical protein